ncbi:MAG: GNAT family N-acetyltransferase [Lachnospiraceae bacterium]|nr:GNAT family N-acetyltransferase [Lachnospiraceae bacterium]MBQ3514644.1 GNAT family N-acetyltransferase [Lachnospiraceae bacterium]MBQ6995823.1 GNAT family N-acetyltransferase [Lachnospiraceae bacterium]
MDKILKKCTIQDLDSLRELSIRTFYETFARFNSKEDMDVYLDDAFHVNRLTKEMNDTNSEFYFLYYNERLAGYLKLNEAPSQTDINDKESLEIERIYVLNEFQGTGCGRALMENAIAKAIERKKKYVWLGVWEKNEKASIFYKKNGFYRIGAHSFFMGDDEQVDYIMRKDLVR